MLVVHCNLEYAYHDIYTGDQVAFRFFKVFVRGAL